MIKKLILLSLLIAVLYAKANEMETVDVKVCVDTTKHADKSFKQVDEMLVSMAQEEGFNSLYNRELGKENKNALSMHHRKDLVVKVNEQLDEGNNFCNNSTVSIKKDRLQYYLPQKVSKDRICHKDGNLSPAKLKEAAALKGYKALISEITDKEISDDLAKTLVHNYKRDDGKLYRAQGAYCFGASGEVVPFEVDMGILSPSSANIKIIKNKAYAKVYASNGKSFEFDVDFNGNGFIFNQKDYDILQTILKDKSADVRGTITTQLLIPDDIQENTVDIKVNGSTNLGWKVDGRDRAWYNTFIDGHLNEPELQGIEVKHNNGLRYVELTIEFNANAAMGFGARHFPSLVNKLKELSYAIQGKKLNSFIFDKSSFPKAYAKVYTSTGKSFEFDVDFNGNGFIFNQKDYKTMQTLLLDRSADVRGTITTQLLIPDDIQGNTVDVMMHGRIETNLKNDGRDRAWYNNFINGRLVEKNEPELQGIEVKHNNGLRYVELTIEFNANAAMGFGAAHFPDLVKYISHISYIAKDSKNGEKWYAVNSGKLMEEQNVQFQFNKKKSNVKFHGNGFIFNQKDYKTMQTLLLDRSADVRGTITTQLLIPGDIQGNTVDVMMHGRIKTNLKNDGRDRAWYNTFINGQKYKSELHGIKVKHNNGLRYVELTIEFNANAAIGFGAAHFPDLVKYISHISYIAKDSKNGEKWYALKPAK